LLHFGPEPKVHRFVDFPKRLVPGESVQRRIGCEPVRKD
jgi:hypothetical protein